MRGFLIKNLHKSIYFCKFAKNTPVLRNRSKELVGKSQMEEAPPRVHRQSMVVYKISAKGMYVGTPKHHCVSNRRLRIRMMVSFFNSKTKNPLSNVRGLWCWGPLRCLLEKGTYGGLRSATHKYMTLNAFFFIFIDFTHYRPPHNKRS
jgi:hypothetical protein